MKIPVFVVLVLATLLCWLILIPLVNSLNIPLDHTYGVISRVVIEGRNPLTNIVIYLILLLSPSFIILLYEFLKTKVTVFGFGRSLQSLTQKIIAHEKFLPIALLLAVTCWTLNISQPFLSSGFSDFSKDGFHYGEKIGLSGAFLQNPRGFFDQAYLQIHGFGLNVIPGVVGFWAGGYERDVSFSLFVVHLQTLLPTIFSFLILLELSTYISAKNKLKVFSLLMLLYFSFYNVLLVTVDRDCIFFVQVLLTVRWIRLFSTNGSSNQNNKIFSPRIIYPILLGFLLPISLLYVYDRFTYSLVLFIYLFISVLPKVESFLLKMDWLLYLHS